MATRKALLGSGMISLVPVGVKKKEVIGNNKLCLTVVILHNNVI